MSCAFPRALLAIALSTGTARFAAAWTANGAPVGPSDSLQLHAAIAPDGSGGAFVVWADARSGNNTRTFAQHLLSSGVVAPEWPSAGLMLESPGYRDHAVVIKDGAGGAYVADDGTARSGIGGFGQTLAYHIGADGSPADGAPVSGITITGGSSGTSGGVHGDYLPALALDGAGGVFYAWTFRDRFSENAKVVRLTPSEASVAGWPGEGTFAKRGQFTMGQEPVACAGDGAGGVFAAWSDYRELTMWVQRFAPDGSTIAGWPARVSPNTANQAAPGIVADGAGGAFIAWQDLRNGAFEQTFAQHLTLAGNAAAGWPVDGLALSPFATEAGIQRATNFDATTLGLSSIAGDGAGGAYVAWTDHRAGDADIYLQHLVTGGIAPGWPAEGLTVCSAAGAQSLPTLGADGAGGVFVAWEDRRSVDADVFAQHVQPDGHLVASWPAQGLHVCAASGDQLAPVIAALDPDRAVVAWTDHRVEPANVFAGLATPQAIAGTPIAPGGTMRLALQGARPNPTTRDLVVAFALPSADAASLSVLDINGRRVTEREVGSLGPGSHVLDLGHAVLAPGVYVIRLAQGDNVRSTRVCVMR